MHIAHHILPLVSMIVPRGQDYLVQPKDSAGDNYYVTQRPSTMAISAMIHTLELPISCKYMGSIICRALSQVINDEFDSIQTSLDTKRQIGVPT